MSILVSLHAHHKQGIFPVQLPLQPLCDNLSLSRTSQPQRNYKEQAKKEKAIFFSCHWVWNWGTSRNFLEPLKVQATSFTDKRILRCTPNDLTQAQDGILFFLSFFPFIAARTTMPHGVSRHFYVFLIAFWRSRRGRKTGPPYFFGVRPSRTETRWSRRRLRWPKQLTRESTQIYKCPPPLLFFRKKKEERKGNIRENVK